MSRPTDLIISDERRDCKNSPAFDKVGFNWKEDKAIWKEKRILQLMKDAEKRGGDCSREMAIVKFHYLHY